jgi:multiple sugar transport system permease protein
MSNSEVNISSEASKPKKRRRYSKQHLIWGFLLIAPTLLGLIILNIYPAIRTITMSFQEARAFGDATFVGLDNFVRLFNDSEFWQALWNTLIYGGLQVPIGIAFSLLFAVLLNKKIKGRAVFRTIFFLPMVAAPAAIAMVWRWLYNSNYGLINQVLEALGFSGNIGWLSNPDLALYSIIIVGIWSSIGYNMILLLAGLQEIPKEYYEASIIDGASPFQQFYKITLPLLSPSLFFVLVTSVITAFQQFDLIYMMIDLRSPALRHTQTLVYLFYDYSFVLNERGYGAAIMVILLIVIGVVTALQQIIQKKWVHYG